MSQSPLVYLKKALDFRLGDWQKLSDADKEWYRKAAEDEIKVLEKEAQ